MEPEKCEGWRWYSPEEVVGLCAGDGEDGGAPKLFLPLRNLFREYGREVLT